MTGKIAKVWIEPGCIVCNACEVQCPEVFDVREDGCVVRSKKFEGFENQIRKAAAVCPVQVIAFSSAQARPAGKPEPPQRHGGRGGARRALPKKK